MRSADGQGTGVCGAVTVYVDDVRHRFGRMVMCHMWSPDLDELHAMAAACGVQRKWFQEPPKASWHHYDVSLSVKAAAMRAGAVLTDKYGPVEHTAWLENRFAKVVQIYDLREHFGYPLDGIIRS
jgi:hypothetical protein